MQRVCTLQLSQPGVRQMRVARPVKAFSAGSSYLGCRLERSKLLGTPDVPSRRTRAAAAAQPVQASFFGVGAPEALLVGVVALLVFGPKGLAQAAKSLGSTLRSFAPTIREITSVSQELKSTLEQEIGINEIREELTRPAVPTPLPPKTDASATAAAGTAADASSSSPQQGAALSELAESMQQAGKPVDDKLAAVIDPDIERKRAEAAAAAWGGALPGAAMPAAAAGTPTPAAAAAAPAAAAAAGAAAVGAAAAAPAAAAAGANSSSGSSGSKGEPAARAVESMSLEELEAELARRKSVISAGQLPKQLSADD